MDFGGFAMAETEPGMDNAVYRAHGALHVRAASKLTAKERESLMDLVRRRAPDPDIFDGEDAVTPFFFNVRASNTKVDSYFTYMSDGSLRNYAADATDPGVQFQVSHNGAGTSGFFGGGEAGQVGFGRSLQGEVIGPAKERSCLIDFYTIPGLQCGNMTSDQFIAGARSGIYADVSIGFTPGAMICNICNGDLLKRWELDWDDPERCTHYPGITYDVEKGRKVEKITAIFRIDEGHLNEVSTVYDGATPGAGIVAVDMARIASARGELSDLDRQILENTYRVRIAPEGRVYAVERDLNIMSARTTKATVVDDTEAEVVEPNAEERGADQGEGANPAPVTKRATVINLSREDRAKASSAVEQDPMERLRVSFRDKGIELGEDPYECIESLATSVLEQNERLESLEREAKDGRDFREGLLKDLDAAVVRVYGAHAAEAEQKRFRRYAAVEDIDGVKRMIADLDERSPFEAGRATRDVVTSEEEPETPADRPARKRGRTPAHLIG
jgi:hypothetical protein